MALGRRNGGDTAALSFGGAMTRERRAALLMLLTLISGLVDAIAYLGLGHVFTANMTGNTVLLGMAIGGAPRLSVTRSATALVGFVAGAGVGAAIVHRGPDHPVWPPAVTLALTLESAALIVLSLGTLLVGPTHGRLEETVLIALAALPMGIQSTAVRRLGVAGVATTVITSTLAEVVSGLVRQPGRAERGEGGSGGLTTLQGAVFLAYGAGAVAGALGDHLWHLHALWLPAALSALAVLAAFAGYHGSGDVGVDPAELDRQNR
ncbi:MAG TPA: YoaK family protein [Thermomicrobiaceae bacterium]|nr:YoaK family protein [Thermomicrobiaceae bacterium]